LEKVFFSQDWNEHRALTQIFGLLINKTPADFTQQRGFNTAYAFSHSLDPKPTLT
jgi:hypothetical protein